MNGISGQPKDIASSDAAPSVRRGLVSDAAFVRVFRGVHQALGRWYWFVLVTLALISLHAFDHTFAVFTNTSPFAESFISDENPQGFVLWHGGLTIADYIMTVLLLGILYRRWNGAGTPLIDRPFRHPVRVLRRLHSIIGRVYWFVFAALVPITFHTADHAIAIVFNTSPLSDTIVANSINHEGFLVWHSTLTILDFAMSLILIRLIYLRWKASTATEEAPRLAGTTAEV